MRTPHRISAAVVASTALALAGCGPSDELLEGNKDLSHLDKFVAFYPREVGLLTSPLFAKRLVALMGEAEFAAMQAYWQTETPIVREVDVISTTSCMDDDCASVGYVLFVDLAANNINVHSFVDGEMMSYDENGPIRLPPGLANAFEVVRQNRLNLQPEPEPPP